MDRVLLEAAARAAGIAGEWSDERNGIEIAVPWRHFTNYETWNPLLDDGDAFRLAVKLFLWEAVRDGGYQRVDSDNDFYAATRRAIVRAAAALGEQHE